MDKRIPVAFARARWLLPAAALSMLGCPNQELAPLGPCTVSAVSERVDQTGIADVDMLFVIDNSGSMAPKQRRLAEELPRLVGVLTSGDKYYQREDMVPADVTQQERFFTKVKTLHLGVVSSNMGGIDAFPSNAMLPGILSCADEGDEGKLLNSTDVAVNGQFESVGGRTPEFDGYMNMGDVVVMPDPECDLPPQPKYQDYENGTPTTDQLALNFRCVATLGARGCPFEQHLESAWRALAPSSKPAGSKLSNDYYKFLNGKKGQGDQYNDGFLRPEAILAIMVVGDEDDCGITDDGKVMFSLDKQADTDYGPLNMRCGLQPDSGGKYLWDPQRYINGFQSLKPDYPDRILFAAITGVPPGSEDKDIDALLAMPAMQFRAQQGNDQLPEPVCQLDGSTPLEKAYPGRRHSIVAKAFGDQGVIYSICNNDFSPALNTLIEKIAAKLKGNCLPRKLTRTDNGTVNCQVYELLPKNDDSKCSSDYGLTGEPVNRRVIENGKPVTRRACQMNQVQVTGSGSAARAKADAKGWYYDDFSAGVQMDCPNAPQRISFQFAGGNGLPSGAGAVFECFQPVAHVETADVKGFDAVNTLCTDDGSVCGDRSNNDYKLICIDGKTCQISCKNNPDCPPGWVCATGNGGTAKGDAYCQLPTCPQDEAASDNAMSSDQST